MSNQAGDRTGFVQDIRDEFDLLTSDFWLTFRRLLTNPGALARAQADGDRQGLLSPVRVFVLSGGFAILLTGGFDHDARGLLEVLLGAGPLGVMVVVEFVDSGYVYNFPALAPSPWLWIVVAVPFWAAVNDLVFVRREVPVGSFAASVAAFPLALVLVALTMMAADQLGVSELIAGGVALGLCTGVFVAVLRRHRRAELSLGFRTHINIVLACLSVGLVLVGATLDVVARAAEASDADIARLNPELLRGMTPPGQRFTLRVPAGSAAIFEANYALIPESERVSFLEHTVVSGETLSHIARRYRVSVPDLEAANPLVRARYLRIGARLTVPVAPSRRSEGR